MAKQISIKEALQSNGTFYRDVWQGVNTIKHEKYVWDKKAGLYEQFIRLLGTERWHSLGYPTARNMTQVEWLEQVFANTQTTLEVDDDE